MSINTSAGTDPLLNPVWHALCGPQAEFARGEGKARMFKAGITLFSAIAEPSPQAYADLAQVLPAGVEARLFRPTPSEYVPAGWTTAFEAPLIQMIADGDPPREVGQPRGLVRLGPDDGGDMLALASNTNPGPFERDTVRIGGYIGIRRDGRLVAMAGHRLRLDGITEISAICTEPDHRGQGLARRLTQILMREIHDAGATPLLHVFPDNVGAHALYLSLGFRDLRELTIRWLLAPTES